MRIVSGNDPTRIDFIASDDDRRGSRPIELEFDPVASSERVAAAFEGERPGSQARARRSRRSSRAGPATKATAPTYGMFCAETSVPEPGVQPVGVEHLDDFALGGGLRSGVDTLPAAAAGSGGDNTSEQDNRQAAAERNGAHHR